jgi:histidine ammonia-lyase
LSILILALCQAADLRGVGEGRERLGRAGAGIYAATRRASPFVAKDRPLARDIAAVNALIEERAFAL